MSNKERAGPFLVEISLGSIMQQILFMLLALLATVEAAGQIRIAQTLLGPMSVIHAGLAPQLLRRLVQLPATGRRKLATSGRNFGLVLGALSLMGAVTLSLILPVKILGHSLLELLTGHYDVNIAWILAICGISLSGGAIILGTGTAARILGLTSVLNKWRLLLIVPQILVVLVTSTTGNTLVAASGLALSTVATAVVSILIVSRNVGRRGRRAQPD